MNRIKKHLNLKSVFTASLLVLFALVVLFVKTTKSNPTNKALGAEENPLICREQPSFTIPILGKLAEGPNNLEIPIGEAIDETEAVAEEIMKQMQVIINATVIEADAANKMVDLAKPCDENLCQKNCKLDEESCYCYDPTRDTCSWSSQCTTTCSCTILPDTSSCCHLGTGCTAQACSGEVCPAGVKDQIGRLQDVIETQVNIINGAYKIIQDIFTVKEHKPIGAWWSLPFCIGCRTDIEQIQEKLEKSRSGDYLLLGLLQSFWYRDPPGLKECVVRPQDVEPLLRGEKVGRFLWTCPDLIKLGIIDEDLECPTDKTKCICYGYNEETNPDRASNFICCE